MYVFVCLSARVSQEISKLATYNLIHMIITLRAKLSGAVYCNRSCMFVCLWVCVFVCGSVTTIPRNCVHRTSPNWVCRWVCVFVNRRHNYHYLQLIKFWPSCAPGEGGLRRGENFWLRLTTASAQCLRLSERFFHSD